MKLFSSHEVLDLTDSEKKNINELHKTMQNSKPISCSDHPTDFYSSFCMQCHVRPKMFIILFLRFLFAKRAAMPTIRVTFLLVLMASRSKSSPFYQKD